MSVAKNKLPNTPPAEGFMVFLKFNSSHLPEGFRAYNPLFEGSARNAHLAETCRNSRYSGAVWVPTGWGWFNSGALKMKVWNRSFFCRYLDPPFCVSKFVPQNTWRIEVYIFVVINLHSFKVLGCFFEFIGRFPAKFGHLIRRAMV